jgi:hypothetical protein
MKKEALTKMNRKANGRKFLHAEGTFLDEFGWRVFKIGDVV